MRALLALAAFAVAGCTYQSDPSLSEARAHTVERLRSGAGTIQSVGVLPRGRKESSAATGGGRDADPNAYRLYILMDSGGFQSVDVDNSTFMAGESVEISPDGRVQRISGTTLNFPGNK